MSEIDVSKLLVGITELAKDRDAARAAGAELQQKLAGILERVTALEPRIAEISAERDAAIEERVRYERAHDLVSRQLGAVARERDAYSEQIEKGGAIYQPLLDDQTDELDRMLSGLPVDDVIRRLKELVADGRVESNVLRAASVPQAASVAVAEALADRDREWRDRLSWATGHGEPKQHPSDSPAWWGGQVALGIKVRQDRYHEATLQIVARLQELEVALAKSQAECRRLAACCPRCGNDDSREACAACGFDRVHDTELAAEICRDLMDADLLAGGAAKTVRKLIAEHTKGGA